MPDADETCFVRVVEAGSLKAAAEQMQVNPSSISRRITALERRLGVKLLQRSTRRSSPTDAGTLYYRGLRRLVDEQAALEAQVSGVADVPRGRFRVTAPVDFGARFVAPVLTDLKEQALELTIELLLGSTFANLVEQGIDVAIRIGELKDSSLRARRLGAVRRVIVGSPAYLDRRGRPESPQDLVSHEFIFYAPGNADRPIELHGPDGLRRTPMHGRITINSITAIRELVERGAGLHFGPVWAFQDGLEQGRLEAVLANYQLPAYPLHAVYPATRYVPAKTRTFIDRMVEKIREEQTLQN